MCDICDVIGCCVRSCDKCKMNLYDKIVMKKRKREKIWKSKKLLHNLYLKEDLGLEFTAC